MLLPILLVVAVLLGGIVFSVARQSSEIRITRSTLVAAPPAAAFRYANDMHQWMTISPYAKMDPGAVTTFHGPPAGKDAAIAWAGTTIGKGRMTVVESQPDRLVRVQLDFKGPVASTAYAEFTFEPSGHQTAVTWTMYGPRKLPMKMVGVIMNLDKMIGAQFEQGLAAIKAAAETATGP